MDDTLSIPAPNALAVGVDKPFTIFRTFDDKNGVKYQWSFRRVAGISIYSLQAIGTASPICHVYSFSRQLTFAGVIDDEGRHILARKCDHYQCQIRAITQTVTKKPGFDIRELLTFHYDTPEPAA